MWRANGKKKQQQKAKRLPNLKTEFKYKWKSEEKKYGETCKPQFIYIIMMWVVATGGCTVPRKHYQQRYSKKGANRFPP